MIIIHTPNNHHLVMFGLSNRITGEGYHSTVDWERKEILTDAPKNVVEKVIKDFLGYLASGPVTVGMYRIEVAKATRKIPEVALVTPEVTVRFGEDIPPDAWQTIKKLIDDVPQGIKVNIRSIELDEPFIERMSRLQGKTFDGYWDWSTGKLAFRNIEVATNPKSFYHEIGHSAFQSRFDADDVEFLADYIALVEKDKPLVEAVRRGEKLVEDIPLGMWEDMADDFADYCMNPELLRKEYPKYARFFERHFPVAIPKAEVGIPEVAPKATGQPFTPETTWAIEDIARESDASFGGYKDTEIGEAIDIWTRREPGDIRKVTRLTRANPEYLDALHKILREQYGDKIVVYRGGGFYRVGGKPIKGAISVTTDEAIAKRFVYGGEIDQFVVDTNKVLAASPTPESELIVYVSDLRPIATKGVEGITPKVGEALPEVAPKVGRTALVFIEDIKDEPEIEGCSKKFMSRKGISQLGVYPSASHLLE